jgi:hypothetical protein
MLRWLSNKTAATGRALFGRQSSQKLPKPDKLTIELARYLTVILGQSPNWVFRLKYVERPKAGKKGVWDIRIFDELLTTANNVQVVNYNSLDDYHDFILYEGWLNKHDGIVFLK